MRIYRRTDGRKDSSPSDRGLRNEGRGRVHVNSRLFSAAASVIFGLQETAASYGEKGKERSIYTEHFSDTTEACLSICLSSDTEI